MSNDAAIDTDDDIVETSTMIKMATPFIALGAAWAVRTLLEKAYTASKGSPPPKASDPDASLRQVILWAAATAAAVAVVNVVVDRMTAQQVSQV